MINQSNFIVICFHCQYDEGIYFHIFTFSYIRTSQTNKFSSKVVILLNGPLTEQLYVTQ
ncbi:hypothetical protein EMIT019CA3_30273 [Bacillus pseudomycoides]